MVVWNVRGLNSRACHDVVKELVAAECPSVVCLQETKLHIIGDYDVMQILGSGFDYSYLP
jgi:exonuclease III